MGESTGFVAHEDIDPSEDWKETIEAALHTCDALCTLLTPDFRKSDWRDQEAGFVAARGILVVPIDLGVKPYGFMGKFQALPVPKGRSRYHVASDVFMALARKRPHE